MANDNALDKKVIGEFARSIRNEYRTEYLSIPSNARKTLAAQALHNIDALSQQGENNLQRHTQRMLDIMFNSEARTVATQSENIKGTEDERNYASFAKFVDHSLPRLTSNDHRINDATNHENTHSL